MYLHLFPSTARPSDRDLGVKKRPECSRQGKHSRLSRFVVCLLSRPFFCNCVRRKRRPAKVLPCCHVAEFPKLVDTSEQIFSTCGSGFSSLDVRDCIPKFVFGGIKGQIHSRLLPPLREKFAISYSKRSKRRIISSFFVRF